MTDQSIVVVTAAVVSIVGTISATVASIYAAKQSAAAAKQSVEAVETVKEVRTMVNGQLSGSLQETSDARAEVAVLDPTKENIQEAITSAAIVADHKANNPENRQQG